MTDKLKVTIVQSDLHWEDIDKNLTMFSEKLQDLEEKTDLIILPEMFTTGFSMTPHHLAEKSDGRSLSWMKTQAKSINAAILGSIIIKEEDKYFNRMYFVFPNGSYEQYDKRHTFTLSKENEHYTEGKEKLIVEYKGWKICPLICYDLRFPVWARNVEEYDVLIYNANWPKTRTLAWDTLLRARAIENMAYCIGVNRVGEDANKNEYIGHSAVYDVLGSQISRNDFEEEFIQTIELSKEHVVGNRRHFQFLNDMDSFQIS